MLPDQTREILMNLSFLLWLIVPLLVGVATAMKVRDLDAPITATNLRLLLVAMAIGMGIPVLAVWARPPFGTADAVYEIILIMMEGACVAFVAGFLLVYWVMRWARP